MMCGRFALYASAEKVKLQFNIDLIVELAPRFNIAPSQEIIVLLQTDDGELHADHFRWGLIPHFARDPKAFPSLINARSETVATKPAFRNSLKSKRGIIIMNGYFEWLHTNTLKQPYYISRKDEALLAIAALWETWASPNGEVVHSCCMITSPANQLTEQFHNRMPVILSEEAQNIWLENNYIPDRITSILTSYPSNDLICYPVTTKMNNWRYDHSDAVKQSPRVK